jgi:hypothetical protein
VVAVLLSRTEHQPEQREHVMGRPSWNCMVDGTPWPCDKAKRDLREQYAEPGLGIYMVSMLYDYVRERDHVDLEPPPALFQRFLAWMTDGGETLRR